MKFKTPELIILALCFLALAFFAGVQVGRNQQQVEIQVIRAP